MICAEQVTYQQLVDKFYSIHDPTTLNRQKGDAGTQYRSGIYYRTDEEKQVRPMKCTSSCYSYVHRLLSWLAPFRSLLLQRCLLHQLLSCR